LNIPFTLKQGDRLVRFPGCWLVDDGIHLNPSTTRLYLKTTKTAYSSRSPWVHSMCYAIFSFILFSEIEKVIEETLWKPERAIKKHCQHWAHHKAGKLNRWATRESLQSIGCFFLYPAFWLVLCPGFWMANRPAMATSDWSDFLAVD
jgi:hypothetical protein